jgi:hypothetical protein
MFWFSFALSVFNLYLAAFILGKRNKRLMPLVGKTACNLQHDIEVVSSEAFVTGKCRVCGCVLVFDNFLRNWKVK